MKLIIDIPKVMYINAKRDLLFGADILVSAIKNGTPHETVTEFADRCRECGREKVLDKIRSEIEQLPTKPDIDYPEIEYVDVTKNKMLEIIDKYKAESEEKNDL